MDGRRSYANEPEPWYTDDDPRHAPGPRDARFAEFGEVTARHGGDPRYGDEPRYDDEPGRPGRGFEPRDPDERDVDPRDFESGGYEAGGFDRRGYDDPGFDDQAPSARRRQTRPTRGKRSGLELPPTPPPGAEMRELDGEPSAPRFHTEALDRNALRRPDQPTWADQPGAPGPGAPGPGGTGPGGSGPAHGGAPGGPSAGGPGAGPGAGPAREDGRPVSGPPPGTVYAAPTQSLPSAAPAQVYRARRPGIAVLLGVVAAVGDVVILLRVFIASLRAEGNSLQGGLVGGFFALVGIPLVAIGLYGLATGAATAGGPNVGRAWLRTPLAYVPIGLVLLVAAGLALG